MPLCKIVNPRQMIEQILAFVYTALFLILGTFFLVYLNVLFKAPKPMTANTYFRYAAAIFFLIVFVGSIVSWMLDCSFNFELPTFGMEDRVTVIG